MIYQIVDSYGETFFFFQAEDGIRDLVRSRGLGDVYKRQLLHAAIGGAITILIAIMWLLPDRNIEKAERKH